jgi:Mrp family chromosome partitioning ATPase
MVTVAVIAQKGGVGKTTLALHLAVEAAKAGPAIIVDIDPQSSAAQWADNRMAKEPTVVACPPARCRQPETRAPVSPSSTARPRSRVRRSRQCGRPTSV